MSLGPTSPTQFDAGALQFKQATLNFDLFREYRDVTPFPLRVAIGAEARNDNYAIIAGEPDSWRNGGFRVLDQNSVATTRPAAPGSQVFPGFKGDSAGKKGDEGVNTRSNVGAYLDLEGDLTSRLLLGIAGRVENYSDFGSTADGKISGRLQLIPGLALRGAASTGFRAPSLMQQYFSSTATNFVAGIPFDIRTFPVSTPEAKALGASDLTAEQSTNYSAGMAWEPVPAFSVTADYYYVGIDDRIIFSENFTGAAVTAKLVQLGVIGVQGGRYFTNAIDTRTEGVDVIMNYGRTMNNGGIWRLTAAYNNNGTRVVRVDSLPKDLAALQEQLFGRVERARIERGNPKTNLILTSNYNIKRANLLLRTQRFGPVTTFGTAASNAFGPLDQTFTAKWITDVSAGYQFGRFTGTVGSDNVWDVYPDRNSNPGSITANNGGNANFGIFPYAGVSPFGFNGRFIYARVSAGL